MNVCGEEPVCERDGQGRPALADARQKVEEWRIDYNRERPHGSLGNLSPEEFWTAFTRQDCRHEWPSFRGQVTSSQVGRVIPALSATAVPHSVLLLSPCRLRPP